MLIGSLNLSGSPGSLHVCNDAIFRQHIRWMSEEFPIIDGLSEARHARILKPGEAIRLKAMHDHELEALEDTTLLLIHHLLI